jgi:hypothetical protein
METGLALKGAWAKAVIIPDTGNPVIIFDWYGFAPKVTGGRQSASFL